MQINLNQPLISVSQKLLFSSFLIFSSIYRSWFDFSKYLYAGGVIFYCYSDQNSHKISDHSIEDYKCFFTFSEQQKIKINFQRPLVLSLCIKPLRDNAMVGKKGNATSLKIRMIYRPLPFCCKRIKHKKIKLIIVIFQTLCKLLLFSHIVGSSRVVTWNLTRAEVHSFLKQCTEVHFASLLSGGFITAIVVNSPEKKLGKRTSVQCCEIFSQLNFMVLFNLTSADFWLM